MNPILLKPTGDRTSQVVVLGRPTGVLTAAEYHEAKAGLRPVVLDALADLRSALRRGAVRGRRQPGRDQPARRRPGQPAPGPAGAGLPAIVVGDIDRGGVFASLYGTVALLPDDLRATVRGFVVNRFRGDPALLGDACADLERRCGVPTLGVVPACSAWCDIDAEDSLALDRADADRSRPRGDVLDVAALRLPRVANVGDLDPLRLEPRRAGALGAIGRRAGPARPGGAARVEGHPRRPGVVPAHRPGGAVERSRTPPVVAVCAGLQMAGGAHRRPRRRRGPARHGRRARLAAGGDRLPGRQGARPPGGHGAAGPGAGEAVAGYRIHHGRVRGRGRADRVARGSRRRRGAGLVAAGGSAGHHAARALRARRVPGGGAAVGRRPGRQGAGRRRASTSPPPAWPASTASPTRWRPTST